MKAEMNRQAEQYIRQNKNKRKVTKLVAILSVLVALLTTYILMLPGITMEYGMVCGLEEHQHSEACYAAGVICGLEERETVTTETVSMVCSVSPHEHSSDCFDSNNERICGMATELFHTHNDFCYDGEGKLICTLPGNAKHVHSESCYQMETQLTCQLEETAGHRHTEACKTQTAAAEPACGLAESAGHAHGDSCFAPDLNCSLTEGAGHIHEESCHQTESALVCTEAEAPAHSHEATCYNEQNELICGMEAGQGGHTHGESCYTQTDSLICGKEEGEGVHTHGDDCYTSKLICTIADGEGAHTHTENCYPMVETITCGIEAGQGAHAHGEACYTASEQLVCTLLHQHDGECVEKDNEGRECVICGMDEVPEHIHTETCREVTTSTIEGHTHTDECNGDVLVCQLTEHTHEDACYPQEEVVVTATPEPSATPEVSSEPTAGPTTEPALLQDDTTYLCGIPEHRHSATCLDEAGSLICGYAEDHLHGELCLVDLTDTVFYCGTEEHLHGFLCFGENNQLLCGVEEEHRHSYECLKDPSAITACYCGMEEHFHGELCYDENWALVCQATEHFHSADCYYACGKQEHVHSATAAGGMMLLSLEESYGCYDAEGKLVCGLEEHTHSEACNTVGMVVQNSRNDQLMTLEETDSTNQYDFGTFVQTVKVYTDGKYDESYKPNYDAATNSYQTRIDISFIIPQNVLENNTLNYQYDLPDEVFLASDELIGQQNQIYNESKEQVGDFWINKREDGSLYLDIKFLDKIDKNSECKGSLYFDCSIAGSATDSDGNIKLEFEKDVNFTVDGSEIKRDESESALYSIETEKVGANNGTAYDPATNTLTYQVRVKTKGTPDNISLTDTLNVSGITVSSWNLQSVQLTNDGQTTLVENPTYTQNSNTMNITLPKVKPSDASADSKAEYLITYQVQLADMGYADVYMSADNSVTATSGTGNNLVKDTDSTSERYEQKMLEKTGSFDQNSDTIQWTIHFNQSGKNIAGMSLSDQMLATLSSADDVKVEPAENFKYLYGSNNEITGIQFIGDSNNQAYTITYSTKPSQDFAGNYAEANKVSVKDQNDTPVADDEYRVDNIDRTEPVFKSVASSSVAEDKKSMVIDWKVEIPIDENGLGNDVIVSDSMSPNGRHYMTYDQLQTLYEQVQDMLAKDDSGNTAMTVDLITSETGSEYQYTQVNINEIIDNPSNYENAQFGSLKFTLDSDSGALANKKNESIILNYSSTANLDGLTTNTQFRNWLGVGDYGNESSNAYVDYVADVANPVSKYCGDDGHNHNEACNWEHQNNNPFSWGISVYQKQKYETIRIEDTLPVDTELTDVCIGQNTQTRLTPDGTLDAEGYVSFTVSDKYDTPGLEISGKYNPTTRRIVVEVKEDTDPNTDASGQFGEGKTLMLKVRAHLAEGAARPAPGEEKSYRFNNTVQVYVDNSNELYDEDSHEYWLKLTTPKLVTKKDMNWQEQDSYIQNYYPDNFGWIVEVRQDQEYDQLEIVDTLPPDLILTSIKVGNTVVAVTKDENGNITGLGTQPHTDEEGLSIVPVYENGSVKITVKRDESKADLCNDPNHTKGYGKDQTLYIRYYFNIPEDQLASPTNPEAGKKYTNSVNVGFTKGETVITGSDDQSITTQFTYAPPVQKYAVVPGQWGGTQDVLSDNAITTSTGQLIWKVRVQGAEQADTVIIEDQLPAGVIELDANHTVNNNNRCVIQLNQNQGYWLQMGESTDGGITYPLKVINVNNAYDTIIGCTATYNAQTGNIRIEMDGETWRNKQVISNDFSTVFYCRVADDYMPNVEDGQYSKELGDVTNYATVSTENGTLGSDGQTQIVTVTQERPNFTVVDKNTPDYDGDNRVLHYSVDINPTQEDMLPAKNEVTLIDEITYSKTEPTRGQYTADRVLTLVPGSVKLYYADYDENREPLKDDKGRLVLGREVDPSEWTMTYTEDNNKGYYNNTNNAATRTITLTVPDSRALILVYDYNVSMNPLQVYDEAPLGVKNSVYVEGFEKDGSSQETREQDLWEYSAAGGSVDDGKSLKLVKHDAANQSNVLEGVTFKIEKFDGTTEQWQTAVDTLTTDEAGTAKWQEPSGAAEGDPQNNVLYRLVETATVTGYQLPESAPAYYFYWSDDDTPAVARPNDMTDEQWSRVPNLRKTNHTFYIPNTKMATSLNVEKVWLDANGETLSGRDLPSSVWVDLKRYAVPVETWKKMLAESNGEIDGALLPGQQLTQVKIEVSNADNENASHHNNAVYYVDAVVGSKLEFDINVNDTRSAQCYAKFDTLTPTYVSGVESNGWKRYHYVVDEVSENMHILGYFYNDSWGNAWGADEINQFVHIENVVANSGEHSDHSNFTTQLHPYIDRSYALPMKLTSEGDWQGIWTNLALEGVDENGNLVHYKYFVTERDTSGYFSTTSGYSSDDGGRFVVTNRKDGSRVEKTNIRVYKKWYGTNGQEYIFANGVWTDSLTNVQYQYENNQWYIIDDSGKTLVTDSSILSQLPLPSVSIRLLQKDLINGTPWENYTYGQDAVTVINDGTNWMYNFVDLPTARYNANGQLVENYDYFIEEVTENNHFAVELIESDTETDETNGKTYEVIMVKNSAIQNVSVTVEKKWADGSMPSDDANITVMLTRQIYTADGYVDDPSFRVNDQTVTLPQSDNWTYTWNNLPNGVVDEATGAKTSYSYLVTETRVNGTELGNTIFEATYAPEDGRAPSNGTLTITNTKVVPKIDLLVEKKWQDKNGNEMQPPADVSSVQLQLVRRASEDDTAEKVAGWETISLDETNHWKLQISGLEKFIPDETTGGSTTTQWIYEIVETDVPEGYNVTYTKSDDGLTLTATNRAVAKMTITKQWQYANGTAAEPDREKVYFQLLQNNVPYTSLTHETNGVMLEDDYITISEETDWTVTVYNLPETAEDGTAYSYTLQEYVSDGNGSFTPVNTAQINPASGNASADFTVINTQHAEMQVKKVWKNAADATNQVQFELYQIKTPVGGGASAGSTGSTDAVDVTYTFEIWVDADFTTENGTYHANAKLESVQRTFKSNERIVWQPQYAHDDVNWGKYCPQGSPNTIQSSLNETFTFVETASTARPWVYSFDLGLAGTQDKTITWRTNNWFWGNARGDNGYDGDYYVLDNWSHNFVTTTDPNAGGSSNATRVGTYTLMPDNWTYTFTDNNDPNVPLLSDGTYNYTYFVKEIGADDYTVVYDNNDTVNGINSGTITMTNEKKQVQVTETTTNLSISKRWVNAANTKPDSLTFQVVQKDETQQSADPVSYSVVVDLTVDTPDATCEELEKQNVELEVTVATDGTDGWTLTLAGLPDAKTVDGALRYDYSYTVTEDAVEGFKSESSRDENGNYTFTNTLTGLLVQKAWVGGEGGEVQFRLWRRAVGEPTGTTCSGGCETAVNSADEHRLACGHYTCATDYDAAEHVQCTDCYNGYVCAGGHGDGVCNGGSGEETVTVSLQYLNPEKGFEKMFDAITVAKDVDVVWRFLYADDWNRVPNLERTSLSYGDETVTLVEQSPSADGTVLAVCFRATHSGTIVWEAKPYNLPAPKIFDSLDYTSVPTTRSTRNTTSTSNINTDGAELVLNETFTLNSTNEWTHFFTGLDATATDGRPYHYFVEEVSVPEGYTVSYSTAEGIPPEGGTIIITNTKETPPEPETISLTVKKEWLNADGSEMANKPNYTVHYEIWAVGDTGATRTELSLPTENNQWEATHTGLPAGRTYYVKEISVTDGNSEMKDLYIITYTAGDDGTASLTPEGATLSSTGSLTITNKLKPTYVLPETGGTGTHLYTGAGTLLAGLALMLLYRRNKKIRRANE